MEACLLATIATWTAPSSEDRVLLATTDRGAATRAFPASADAGWLSRDRREAVVLGPGLAGPVRVGRRHLGGGRSTLPPRQKRSDPVSRREPRRPKGTSGRRRVRPRSRNGPGARWTSIPAPGHRGRRMWCCPGRGRAAGAPRRRARSQRRWWRRRRRAGFATWMLQESGSRRRTCPPASVDETHGRNRGPVARTFASPGPSPGPRITNIDEARHAVPGQDGAVRHAAAGR